MSEMEWEEPPAVYVPKVRDWVGPAFEAWTALFWRRRGFFIVGGCLLFPIWAFIQFAKVWIYGAGILALIAAYLLWIPIDLLTYRRRLREAALAQWGPYMRELDGEGPPQIA